MEFHISVGAEDAVKPQGVDHPRIDMVKGGQLIAVNRMPDFFLQHLVPATGALGDVLQARGAVADKPE